MKKVLLLVALTMGMTSFGQEITYNQVNSSVKRPSGKFESYVSKDGRVYSIGDTIKLGMPSGTNGKFVFLQKFDIGGNQYIVGPEAANTHIILKKIRVGGSKRSGWKVAFQTKGFTFIDNYFLNIEDAIKSGEVNSGVMSSDEALSELKKAKDKLDLGLITKEEFDEIRTKLSKLIK